jgi:hypothetical protein
VVGDDEVYLEPRAAAPITERKVDSQIVQVSPELEENQVLQGSSVGLGTGLHLGTLEQRVGDADVEKEELRIRRAPRTAINY